MILCVTYDPEMEKLVRSYVSNMNRTIVFPHSYQHALDLVNKGEINRIIFDFRSEPEECGAILRMVSVMDKHIPYAYLMPEGTVLQDGNKILWESFFAPDGQTRKRHVLIIEDDEDIRDILTANLLIEGFVVDVACDGEMGLHMVLEKAPDVVILDIGLPKLAGTEVCKRIRETPGLAQLPILMLTAKATDVDKVVGKVVGASMYMTKPFDIELVVTNIRNLIQG